MLGLIGSAARAEPASKSARPAASRQTTEAKNVRTMVHGSWEWGPLKTRINWAEVRRNCWANDVNASTGQVSHCGWQGLCSERNLHYAQAHRKLIAALAARLIRGLTPPARRYFK